MDLLHHFYVIFDRLELLLEETLLLADRLNFKPVVQEGVQGQA